MYRLCISGFPGSRLEQCLFPYEALERVGVRLISVDRPGWGLTDPLAGDRVARARDVLRVADHLGIDQFPLMAISAGGGYGVALAATAPTRIARLVLVSAQAAPYDDPATITTMQPGQLAVLAATRAGRTAGFVDGCAAFRREFLEDLIGRFWSNFATLSAAERAFIEQPEVRNTFIGDMTEGLRTSPDGVIDDLLSWPQPLEVDLTSITCPVIAIHGTDDDWEPLANLRRVIDQIPDAHLWLCAGMNHLGPLLHPAAVLALTCDA